MKSICILLGLGKLGQDTVIDLMEEMNERYDIIAGILLSPSISHSVTIKAILSDLTSTKSSLTRRNKAAKSLALFGGLLDNKKFIDKISSLLEGKPSADPQLLAECLMASGLKGRKALLKLLGMNIQKEVRTVICRFLRDYSTDSSPILDPISITEEFLTLDYNSPNQLKWDFDDNQGILFFNKQEAESLIRQYYLQHPNPASNEYNPGRSFIYSVLNIGSRMGARRKIPSSVIRELTTQLSHQDGEVREAALSSLGNIGLPEVKSTLPQIEQYLKFHKSYQVPRRQDHQSKSYGCLVHWMLC